MSDSSSQAIASSMRAAMFDRVACRGTDFEANELMDAMAFGVSLDEVIAMLIRGADEIARHANG